MSRFSIRMIGMKPLLARTALIPNGVVTAIRSGMKEAAFLVEKEGKKQVTSGPNRALLTGTLRSDIKVRSVNTFSARIGPLVNYAYYVHEGRGTHTGRGPRPFMLAAIRETVDDIEKILGKSIRKAIRLR